MKTVFYLKESWRNDRFSVYTLFMFFIILFLMHGLYKEISVSLVSYVLLAVCAFLYKIINDKISGLYINETNIVYRRLFFKRKVDAKNIDCIRLNPESVSNKNPDLLKDENGNTLFQMFVYNNYYEKDKINGCDFIEEIKRMFIEKQLACCIYDKEALDYILTLNPNIKVVYYDEK